MSRHIKKTGEIDAPVETVYQVVADVEAYPEFLPGVRRVVRLENGTIEMTVGLGPIDVTWTSTANFTPYKLIVIDLVEGPFRRMDVRWEFTPQGEGTRIEYTTDYELRLPLPGMGRIVSRAIEANTDATMRAFRRRVLSL